MGLRARLTLFTGVVLVIVVAVLIASGQKHQDRIFSERVERETSPYFLPARKLVVESGHLEKNLIRIEDARLTNEKNRASYGDRDELKARFVFPDDFFKDAIDLQKKTLAENERDRVAQFIPFARFAASRRTEADFPIRSNYVQNLILQSSDFYALYTKLLTGIDRRIFRIQSLDRTGQLYAYTVGIHDVYDGAAINQLVVQDKIPAQSLYSVASGTLIKDNQKFLMLTTSISRNEQLAFRARQIMQANESRRLASVIRIDQKFVKAMKTTGQALLARETALAEEKGNKLPLLDPEWKKLMDSYSAQIQERDQALLKALHRLAPESREASEAMDDAVRNLRDALLDSELILQFSWAEFARGYSQREDWRKQFENRYAYLRAWILSGGYESIYGHAGANEMMLFNRREALARMISLDSTPIVTLAERALTEDSAGYVRILVDLQKFQAQTHQQDRMLDTALAFALRVFFLVALLSTLLVRRIRIIIEGARSVGKGILTVKFDATGSDEVSDLARSLDVMVHGLREREELRGEMSAAEEIQKRLLPEKMPANMEGYLSFGTFYKAMMGVGGDYFDLLEAGTDKMAFCVADVSSHGAGPAIIMTMLRAHLHGIIRRTRDPRAIMNELNARMFEDTPPHVFITMFLGIFDKNTNQIEAVNAGHNKSIVYRYKTGQIEEFDTTTLPLGAVDNSMFTPALATQTIKLSAGDLFFQFTDGLNEAMNNKEEQFGVDRLKALVQEGGKKKPVVILENVAKAVEAFTGKPVFLPGPSEYKDDIAMIAFRRIR